MGILLLKHYLVYRGDVLLHHKSKRFTALTRVVLCVEKSLGKMESGGGGDVNGERLAALLSLTHHWNCFPARRAFLLLTATGPADGCSSRAVISTVGRAGRASAGSLIARIFEQ